MKLIYTAPQITAEGRVPWVKNKNLYYSLRIRQHDAVFALDSSCSPPPRLTEVIQKWANCTKNIQWIYGIAKELQD